MPLHLVKFHQEWTDKFENFDMFLDTFSNLLIFHNEGYFVIWDEFQRSQMSTKVPFTLNLAATYKNILAIAVHPSKSCLAIQVAPTELTLLFLKQRQAEEVRF